MPRAIVIGPLLGIAILIAGGWTCPLAVVAQPVPLHSSNPSAQLFDDTIIVKYRETSLQTNDPLQRRSMMNSIAGGLPGVTPIRTLPIVGVQRLRLRPGQLLNDVILTLRSTPVVQYAEYNYRVTGLQQPNDPRWLSGWLWGLTKIRMVPAWEVTHGAGTITVAVLDSGIDYLHEDLSPNMPGSLPNQRGVVTCNTTQDPMDTNGHGTLVAGVIGARGGNGKGGVGVNWVVNLWAAKFLCGRDPLSGVPSGSVADAIEAIDSAISKRAAIINNSWRVVPPVASQDILTLQDAVRRTNCEGQNLPPNCKPALFVAAAGNTLLGEDPNSDNVTGKVYPANFVVSNVIAVAATDSNDNLWSGSHYGTSSVPIAAPGVDIDSTYLRTQGDGYSTLTGTSMAAPHVTGCAALLQAQSLLSSNSLLSIQSLKDNIINGADQISALNPYITMGRRLNCGCALTRGGCGDRTSPAPPTGLTVR